MKTIRSFVYLYCLVIALYSAYKFFTLPGGQWMWFLSACIWGIAGTVAHKTSHFDHPEE